MLPSVHRPRSPIAQFTHDSPHSLLSTHPPGTQPNKPCSRTRPPPPLDSSPFRFLDLSKDVRFMVYDLMSTVTRHHTIIYTQRHDLKIVTRRLSGLSLLRTCRTINLEAKLLYQKLEALRSGPLRIMVPWRRMAISSMQDVLQRAAKAAASCVATHSINRLSPECGPCDIKDRPFSQVQAMHRDTRLKYGIQSPFTTHDEPHALIDKSSPSDTTRRVEAAIGCTDGITLGMKTFVFRWTASNSWLNEMQDAKVGKIVCDSEAYAC